MYSVGLSSKNLNSRTNPLDYKNDKTSHGINDLKTSNLLGKETIDAYSVDYGLGQNPPQFDIKAESVSDIEDGIENIKSGKDVVVAAGAAYAAGANVLAGILGIVGAGLLFGGLGLLGYGIAFYVKDVEKIRKESKEKEQLEKDLKSLLGELADLSRNGLNVSNSDRSGDREPNLGEHSQTDTILDGENSDYDNSDRE